MFYFLEVNSILEALKMNNGVGCCQLVIKAMKRLIEYIVCENRNLSQKIKGILLTSCTCKFLQHQRKGIQTDIQQS